MKGAEIRAIRKRMSRLGVFKDPLITGFSASWCGFWRRPGIVEKYLEDTDNHPAEGLNMQMGTMLVLMPWLGCPYDENPVKWGFHDHTKMGCEGKSCPHYCGQSEYDIVGLRKLVDSMTIIPAE